MAPPTRFDLSFEFTMTQEGGEVTYDPNLTKWGCEYEEAIAYRSKHHLHIPEPEEFIEWWVKADSKPVFMENYWNPCACDKLAPSLDVVVFDTAVNIGVENALQMLIAATGTALPAKIESYLNIRRKWYKDRVVSHPEKKKYLSDWLGRCSRLDKAIKNTEL